LYVQHGISLKHTAAAFGVVALGLTLAACGGSGNNGNPFPVKGGTSAAGGSGSGSSSSGGVVSQSGQGARLNATTLSGADIAADVESADSWLPSDLKLVGSGGQNSGSAILTNSYYKIPSMSCIELGQEYGGPAFGEQAYYSNSALNSSNTAGYEWAVYEFPTAADAQSFVKDLAAKFASCGKFSGKNTSGGQVSGSYSVGPASEAQVPMADTAFDAHVTVTASQTANADLVAAADGNIVVFGGSVALSSATLSQSPTPAAVVENILSAVGTGVADQPSPTTGIPTTTAVPEISIPALPSVDTGAGQ
jgi:hypothetical protein